MAKKVHITLVGGQPTPVFQGILYSNPDKVIYICSKQTIGKVNSIQKRLKAIQEKYKNNPETQKYEDFKNLMKNIEILFHETKDSIFERTIKKLVGVDTVSVS